MHEPAFTAVLGAKPTATTEIVQHHQGKQHHEGQDAPKASEHFVWQVVVVHTEDACNQGQREHDGTDHRKRGHDLGESGIGFGQLHADVAQIGIP